MIEPAYEALVTRISDILVAATFLAAPAELKVDPPSPFTPTGDERQLVRAASLVKIQTKSVRQILGRPIPRHVVERECRLELALAGPARALRLEISNDVLDAIAALPGSNPTLDGTAERFVLNDQTDDDLPPNGISIFFTFTIRVRSGDPLGRTP